MSSALKKVGALANMFEGLASPRGSSSTDTEKSSPISPLPGFMSPAIAEGMSAIYGSSQTPQRQLMSAISLLSLRGKMTPSELAEQQEYFSQVRSNTQRRGPRSVFTATDSISSNVSVQHVPVGESTTIADKDTGSITLSGSKEQEKYFTTHSSSYFKDASSKMAAGEGSPSNSSFKSFDSNSADTTRAKSRSSRSAKSVGFRTPSQGDSLPSPNLRRDEVVRPYTVKEIEDMFSPKQATPPVPPRTLKRKPSSQEWIDKLASGRGIMRGSQRGKEKDAEANETTHQLEREDPEEATDERSCTKTILKGLGITGEIQIRLEVMEEDLVERSNNQYVEASTVKPNDGVHDVDNSKNLQDSPATIEGTRRRKQVRPVKTNLVEIEDVLEADSEGGLIDDEAFDDFGLGINFYSVNGEGKRSEMAKEATDKQTITEVATIESASPKVKKTVVLPTFVELNVLFQSPEGLGGDASVLAEAHTSSPLLGTTDAPGYNYELHINPGDSPESLIDELLETSYRGQAASFSKKSTAASVRSITSSARSTPSSTLSAIPLSIELRSTLRSVSAPIYTPTRQPTKGESFASSQRKLLLTPSNNSSADTPNKLLFKPYKVSSGGRLFSPAGELPASPHNIYGHVLTSTPLKNYGPPPPNTGPDHPRGFYYFTEKERQVITDLVAENYRGCDKHEHCTECLELEFAYYENKTMPTSMPPEERQKIINNNRSLRNIKNELESLLEHGAITDEAYNAIISSLPGEFSLNGPARSAVPSPSPAPTAALNNLNLHNNEAPPPAYNNPTPPSLPGRQESSPPSKPELARAIGLYRYAAPGDCNFEVGDQIVVTDFTNNEWWYGKNLRTGVEGVFPTNYVQQQTNPSPPLGHYGNNEKSGGYGGGYPGMAHQAQQGPPPPGPSNPYNSSVPPMAIAEQPVEGKPGKGQEMGKKFGKKLGNAAIFGAGATIGGNIVNSIF